MKTRLSSSSIICARNGLRSVARGSNHFLGTKTITSKVIVNASKLRRGTDDRIRQAKLQLLARYQCQLIKQQAKAFVVPTTHPRIRGRPGAPVCCRDPYTCVPCWCHAETTSSSEISMSPTPVLVLPNREDTRNKPRDPSSTPFSSL